MLRATSLLAFACAAAGSPALDALNQFRSTNGLPPLTECSTDAFATKMANYDAAHGKHAYITANGWTGACGQSEGSPEGCETDEGTTWAESVPAMGTSCRKQLTDPNTCAAFGMCTNCAKSATGKVRDFWVVNLCRSSKPINGTGLDAINKYRAAKGQAALTDCGLEAKAQEIVEYDAVNGAGAYVNKNKWDGVCAPNFVGQEEQCETNGYNGGNDGLTWDNAVTSMKTSCPSALTGKHKCASFGNCVGCSKSKSGKPRNYYVVNLC